MVAGLPGEGARSLDALSCAVTILLGDVVDNFFFFNELISAVCCLEVFFRRCRSRVVLLQKTRSKFCAAWLGAAFGVLALLLVAGAASAAPCDIKNNAPPFIRHDLTDSYCELCGYGYSTTIVSNPYRGVDMTDMALVENLRSFGLTCDPSAPMPVTYRVSGANGSIPTWNATQIPDFGRLEDQPGNNQFNTINALAANKTALPGGSPTLVASNYIFDFIVTGDFAVCTSNFPWGEAYERFANRSVYLGGKIWT